MSAFQNKLSGLKNNTIVALLIRYMKNDVGTRAAALAYYMVFSIFPLLILTVLIVSRLDINTGQIYTMLKPLLPADLLSMLSGYFTYVKQSYNQTLLVFAVVFSIYFPWRAVRGLMKDIRISFGLPPAPLSLRYILKELLCTLVLPVTIITTLLFFVFGQNVLSYLMNLFPEGTFNFSIMSLDLWEVLRFFLAALLMSTALGIVYELSLDHRIPIRKILPGIAFAVIVWVITSIIFSWYVENFADYSIIYGTLGAFIVLLLWLFLTAMVLIMGSEYNGILLERDPAQTKDAAQRKTADYPNKKK